MAVPSFSTRSAKRPLRRRYDCFASFRSAKYAPSARTKSENWMCAWLLRLIETWGELSLRGAFDRISITV
jgi:hypothetical protein